MKKFIKPFVFILFFLICYLTISFILKKMDPQPEWGEIDTPKVAFSGKDIVFTLHYEEIQSPLQLFIALTYRNDDNIFCGQKNYTDSIPIIHGSGKIQKRLSFYVPDSVYKVMIRISLHVLPQKQGISIYKCKRVGKPLKSEWIYVSKDGSLPHDINLSYTDILKKGYLEGYWIVNRGDPTVIGWFITLFYFFVFATSFYLLKKITPNISNNEYMWFWYGVTILIILLGINKQLDIQMLFADFARLYAKVIGIFENRKPFQHKIISFLTTIGISIFSVMIYKFWYAPKRMWLALIGFCILFSFPIIRLVSLHSIESLLSISVLYIKIVDVIEILGITIVLIAIILNYSSCKNSQVQKSRYNNYTL